jgi:phosphoadenosine phosphosulfate reductase
MKDAISQLSRQAESWSPEEVLAWAFENYGNDVAIASGFGVEGMALIDLASRVGQAFRVFTLDTEFLFPETYELIDRVEKRYAVRVERVYSALTPEDQEDAHGAELWRRDPDFCCSLRKVVPLKVKLAGLRAWITAIRRQQTSARASAKKIDWDPKFQLAKINPIADWTSDMVWSYVRRHEVPYNPLHDRNYPSIGCTHCTRAVRSGEDARAGRWAGFAKTECGLHVPSKPPVASPVMAGPLVQLKPCIGCEEV